MAVSEGQNAKPTQATEAPKAATSPAQNTHTPVVEAPKAAPAA
jgi:hypothetical protein